MPLEWESESQIRTFLWVTTIKEKVLKKYYVTALAVIY